MGPIYVILGVILWLLLGCIVVGCVDKNKELLNWLKEDPTGGWVSFVFFIFWPVLLIVYLRGHRNGNS